MPFARVALLLVALSALAAQTTAQNNPTVAAETKKFRRRQQVSFRERVFICSGLFTCLRVLMVFAPVPGMSS